MQLKLKVLENLQEDTILKKDFLQSHKVELCLTNNELKPLKSSINLNDPKTEKYLSINILKENIFNQKNEINSIIHEYNIIIDNKKTIKNSIFIIPTNKAEIPILKLT